MKYFILSEQQLLTHSRLSEDIGRVQESRLWTEEKERLRIEARTLYEESFREIPDFVNMIVGYSTPNPNEIEIWHRDQSGNLEGS